METIHRRLKHGGGRQTPSSIVVHSMAYQIDYDGERLYAVSFLDRIGLSAHLLVSLDGTLIRCRRDDEVAWHAKGHNLNSLGIEFLVPDCYNYSQFVERIKRPFLTNKQFEAGVEAVRQWKFIWDIQDVQRHSDIDPERKVDPGEGLDWEEFKRRIKM